MLSGIIIYNFWLQGKKNINNLRLLDIINSETKKIVAFEIRFIFNNFVFKFNEKQYTIQRKHFKKQTKQSFIQLRKKRKDDKNKKISNIKKKEYDTNK